MNFKKFFTIFIIFLFIITPTICLADDYIEENPIFLDNLDFNVSSDISQKPNINARYAIIFDRASKTILFGKNENEKSKMASTTKILTALVVIENCNNLNDVVTISKKSARNRWIKTWFIHK